MISQDAEYLNTTRRSATAEKPHNNLYTVETHIWQWDNFIERLGNTVGKVGCLNQWKAKRFLISHTQLSSKNINAFSRGQPSLRSWDVHASIFWGSPQAQKKGGLWQKRHGLAVAVVCVAAAGLLECSWGVSQREPAITVTKDLIKSIIRQVLRKFGLLSSGS